MQGCAPTTYHHGIRYIASGRLVCQGPAVDLKREYCFWHKLTLNRSSVDNQEDILRVIRRVVPEAKVDVGATNSEDLAVILPRERTADIGEVRRY